jgi:hypothetical protein
MRRRDLPLSLCKLILSASVLGATLVATHAVAAVLAVPAQHPTIQSAIDAAEPGDTVSVSAGSYVEQLVVRKELTLIGAGMDVTVIRAPKKLRLGRSHDTSIVEVYDGATFEMSQLTVSGPGAGTCKKGALRNGIRVHDGAHLALRSVAVRNIHDSPRAPCFRSGHGILAGAVDGTASVDVRDSEITNYQTAGIVVLGAGSIGDVQDSSVVGPGPGSGVSTDGIELVAGAVGTIAGNVVSGNVCQPDSASCGPDFFNQFQHGGIVAGGNGPGTVITDNLVFGNQIGMYLSEADEISGNVMVDNDLFGLGLVGWDGGSFTVSQAHIRGGGGVWVVGVFVDTTVVLDRVSFAALSGPAVEELECCGYTATVVGGP